HAKSVGKFGITKVFTDKRNFSGVLCCNFLGQQTCWVGNVSSVGPADQSERGRTCSLSLYGRSGFERRVIRGKHLLHDHPCTPPLIGTGGSALGLIQPTICFLKKNLGD